MFRKNNNFRNRKKIKIKRKKTSKIFLIVSLFILITILFIIAYYFLTVFSRASYINPLAAGKYKENIKLEEELSKANVLFITTTALNDSSFLVVLTDKEEVIFSSKKDLQSQIASLQLITKRLTIEGKRFKRLDFRYDKPVIEL